MPGHRTTFLCGLAAAAWLSAAPQALAAAAPTDCDKLAGAPTDPNRVSDGVGPYGVDAQAAIQACEKAVQDAPDDPRLVYQLGRAHQALFTQDKRDGELALAAKSYAIAAARFYPHAEIALASMQWLGSGGTARDPAGALALIDKAAKADAVPAKRMRVQLFEKAVEAAPGDPARKLVEAAADKGDADALAAFGFQAEVQAFGNADVQPDMTVDIYLKASGAGSGAAAMALLRIIAKGGLVKGDKDALSLMRIAADGDDPRALYDAAMAYSQGVQGVEADQAMAAKLLKRASEGGEPKAARMLSAFYAVGQGGLPIDKPESKRLERLAADEGDEESVLLVAHDMEFGFMWGNFVDKSQSTKADAIAFLTRAARWSKKAQAKLKEMEGGQ